MGIDCEDCQTKSYDLKTGKLNTYDDGDGNMLPILRLGNPPPCEDCPKGSPENGKKLRLSERNYRAVDFYNRAKAMPQMQSALFQCPVTQRNFRLIDSTIERAKAAIAESYTKKRNEGQDDER